MIPTTVNRVSYNTTQATNDAIRSETLRSIEACASSGRSAIDRRLRELDEEWDIERLLEANASVAALTFLAIGASGNRRGYLCAAFVAGFLLQHSFQGWCPPLSLFRRLGFRTAAEISYERYALKALRGDFAYVSSDQPFVHGAAVAAFTAAQV